MSPPRPPHIHRKKRKPVKRVSVCDSCMVYRCTKENEQAKAELFAVMNDQPVPVCDDYEPEFYQGIEGVLA